MTSWESDEKVRITMASPRYSGCLGFDLLSPRFMILLQVAAIAAYLADGAPLPGQEKKLSKNQLKNLKKNKGKVKKDKPTWNQPKETKAKKTAPAKSKFINTTPKGQKKELTSPMEDGYFPSAVEAAWQDWWEASGFYSCAPGDAETATEKFVMVIPPPNVTGSLHLGHALTAAVEDTLTRWHRMKGHATLYVPGTKALVCCFTFARVHWAATCVPQYANDGNRLRARLIDSIAQERFCIHGFSLLVVGLYNK
jgi:tRNA synthetases class I (I, L, M and V)